VPALIYCRDSCRGAKIRPVQSGSRRIKQHLRAGGLVGRRGSADPATLGCGRKDAL